MVAYRVLVQQEFCGLERGRESYFYYMKNEA